MTQALLLTTPDALCWDDVDAFARETTSDLETAIQDLYHMLIEDPGTNIDLPDRGIGIARLLSGPISGLTTAANKIDQQVPLDARFDSCATTISIDSTGTYQLALKVGVDGSVYGVNFAFNAQAGLTLVNWGPT